jgi:hypothetical protein
VNLYPAFGRGDSRLPTFPIANLNLLDVNVILVFPDHNLESKSNEELQDFYWKLQRAATDSDLPGNIVLVWQDQSGRTKFVAPPPQHAFFRAIKYEQLRAQINGSLPCD